MKSKVHKVFKKIPSQQTSEIDSNVNALVVIIIITTSAFTLLSILDAIKKLNVCRSSAEHLIHIDSLKII